MLSVVAISEAGAEEHPAEVDVVRDVTAFQRPDRGAHVPLKNLYRHGGFLLANANERIKTPLQLVRRRLVGPDSVCRWFVS